MTPALWGIHPNAHVANNFDGNFLTALPWTRTHEELSGEPDEARLRERALAQLLDFAERIGRLREAIEVDVEE